MSGQAKISAFFSTTPKRSAETENVPPKKAKMEKGPISKTLSPPSTPTGSKTAELSLSPEQKQRMEQNRLKALAKLHQKSSHSLLVGFGDSWRKALETEFSKPYFEKLSEFVHEQREKATVYPTPENVFSWTRACTLDEVKVVILGQDPYHGPNQAHGLSFSVMPGVPPPPSLLNMYKELENDVEAFKRPKHGYLQGWARQGVLMLNACLTVRAKEANSHKDRGWEKFTDATISYLNKNRHGLVFILWGSYAQKKGAVIDKKRHHVLTGVHPSPLSAHRGFFGCKHFSRCNKLLEDENKTPIDWSDLPDH